ncbi:hypothetical protein chiPu_0031727 [Chiloscyllium punctatum]|uniref:Uncharacterized protein n=1 Tax=Chiloscyllium punctatum TaxID=137246 RepID=A0A401TXT3_CHIPU|nr:hypothetical protein [Chiloscyllium punctatum]
MPCGLKSKPSDAPSDPNSARRRRANRTSVISVHTPQPMRALRHRRESVTRGERGGGRHATAQPAGAMRASMRARRPPELMPIR